MKRKILRSTVAFLTLEFITIIISFLFFGKLASPTLFAIYEIKSGKYSPMGVLCKKQGKEWYGQGHLNGISYNCRLPAIDGGTPCTEHSQCSYNWCIESRKVTSGGVCLRYKEDAFGLGEGPTPGIARRLIME